MRKCTHKHLLLITKNITDHANDMSSLIQLLCSIVILLHKTKIDLVFEHGPQGEILF